MFRALCTLSWWMTERLAPRRWAGFDHPAKPTIRADLFFDFVTLRPGARSQALQLRL
jgi:hypothetical protein